MKQGEIYWATLDPVEGSEQAGQRPVLIISGDTMNSHFDIVIVCPLTSRLKNFPGSVLIPTHSINGLEFDSEVIAFQVRTLSKKRLGSYLGQVTQTQLKQVIFALNEVFIY